eukprot:GFYU01001762.1.p1 GENE.GFYU01001762.1~~GFYU01001762.1.p1  ORF type:complete len:279 (-),score=57.12 GFYU01001762.1:155-991(-)
MGDNQIEVLLQERDRFANLCSPVFDHQNVLCVASQNGEICRVSPSGTLESFANSGGSPAGLAFTSEGDTYICDHVHQAVLLRNENNDLNEVVKEYEGQNFKGPSSVVFDSSGTMYFTDSGPMGETSLANPRGSVFSVSGDGQLLHPLALNCMAHPSGIALSPDDATVYVCETLANRVIRFVQKPAGVFHSSVFYQCSGSLGPTAVQVDGQGRILVAMYDFAGCSSDGRILVLGADGSLQNTIVLTGAPEISGMTLNQQKDQLYITETSTNSIYLCPLL